MTQHRLQTLAAGLLATVALSCGRSAATKALDAEPVYREAFTGWAVADAVTGERLSTHAAERLFTPASNVKLLTLATALAWLPNDSLPAIAYRTDGDTLRLWATAYPMLGDGDAAGRRIGDRLRAHEGPIEVSLHGFGGLARFGCGWMWDDYNGNYARERSGLPVYGNLARAWRDSAGTWRSRPGFLVVSESAILPKGQLARAEGSNRYRASAKTPNADTVSAPLFEAQALTAQLLEDWLQRPVRYHARALPEDWRSRTLPGLPRDSLLRAMMLPSDNFLAEQLLLHAGFVAHGLTAERQLQESARKEVLGGANAGLVRWADASGMSHYNLAAPEAIVDVLTGLHATYDWASLSRLFARGGEPGSTLGAHYAPAPGARPWLWAKTGTLRHTHCLSGFLRADSGRLLAFSIMHNHYGSSTSTAYRDAMDRSLRKIKAAY